ncbi:MAG: hypothetical protein GYA24_18005 [Candidatus Lokiarchaeota archaeon]|nr:hypothetical protein [Candidatus Lokiarchaeota archaeon]
MGKDEEDLAENPASSPEMLDTLAKSRRIGVKMRVAANPNTRPGTLQYLAENNKVFDIMLKILQNPKTPDAVFLYYVQAPKQAECVRLLSLRQLSKEHLKTLIDNLQQAIAESKRSVLVWPPAPGQENSVDDQKMLEWMTKRHLILPWAMLAEALRISGDWAGAMDVCKQVSYSGVGMVHYDGVLTLEKGGDNPHDASTQELLPLSSDVQGRRFARSSIRLHQANARIQKNNQDLTELVQVAMSFLS